MKSKRSRPPVSITSPAVALLAAFLLLGSFLSGATFSLGTYSSIEGPAAGMDFVVLSADSSSSAWTAAASNAGVPWLHTVPGFITGSGSAVVAFSFDSNPGGTRTGTFSVGGQTLTVTQTGADYGRADSIVIPVPEGLQLPYSVAVDASGNIYVSDFGSNSIKRWSPATQALSTLVESGLNYPKGVAVDSAGNVFIADTGNNALKVWRPQTQTVSTLISNLLEPQAVAVDDQGNVYITDSGHNSVKKWDAGTQTTTTLIASGLSYPQGIAVDEAGNLYIAHTVNQIVRWDAQKAKVESYISGANFYPRGVAVDGSGNLFYTSDGDSFIRESPPFFAPDDTVIVSSGIDHPKSVAVDTHGTVYIADYGNNRIKALRRGYALKANSALLSLAPTAGSGSVVPLLPIGQPFFGDLTTANSTQSWLAVTAVDQGSILFSFEANFGFASRSAQVSFGDVRLTITQAADPASVVSLTRAAATPTNASTIYWTLEFDRPVSGVTAAAFSITGGASPGATIGIPTTQDGIRWSIPVATSVDGDLTLRVVSDAAFVPRVFQNSLPFLGEKWVIDKTPPVVSGVNAEFSPLILLENMLPDYRSQALANDLPGGANLPLVQIPPAGSAVPQGLQTVRIIAVDAAGNEGSTSFEVAVRLSIVSLLAGVSPVPDRGSPGGPASDSIFSRFGMPAIDDAGSVAFLGRWEGVSGGSGLFHDGHLVARVGGDASAIVGSSGATWQSFTDPVLSAGHLACIAAIKGVPKAKASVVLELTDLGLRVVAQSGGAATADGAKYLRFQSVMISPRYTCFLARLTPGSGVPKVNGANDVGLWVKDSVDPPRVILREGQLLPNGRKIRTLVSLAAGAGSAGQGRGWLSETDAHEAQILALVLCTDGSREIVSVSSANIVNPSTVAVTGVVNPASGSPAIAGASFASVGLPAANTDGMTAFLGSLKPRSPMITPMNARGVFAAPADSPPTAVVREGDDPSQYGASFAGTKFAAFKDPVLAEDGNLAFFATISGQAATGLAGNTVWWRSASGVLKLIAQGGPSAISVSGLPGAQYKSFTTLAVSEGRGPVFCASLVPGKGGVPPSGASGVWAIDSRGSVRLLFRTGETGTIIAGKTLKNFSLLSATAGSTGVSRSLNRAGQVAWVGTFADRSQAIIITKIP